MSHPYSKYSADKVGRRRAQGYQDGGSVFGKLPVRPRDRGNWNRLNQTPAEMQRDHDYEKGMHFMKTMTKYPILKDSSMKQARDISDAVPRGNKDE